MPLLEFAKTKVRILCRIYFHVGVTALWKGAATTMVRACFLNVGMLTTNEELKEQFSAMGYKGWDGKLMASALAGFFASFLSLPFDFAKTRIQKQQPDKNGVLPYKSLPHCMGKVFREEGITAFWRGFPTFYTRIAPHVMIVLIMQEVVNKKLKENGY